MNPLEKSDKKRILFISVEGVGNTILALPVFLAYQARGMQIDVVVSDNGSQEVTSYFQAADRIFLWHEKKSWLQNLLRLASSFRRFSYDSAYAVCPAGRRGNALLRLACAKEKKGWRSSKSMRLLSFRDKEMPFWDEKDHDLVSNQKLTGLLDEEVQKAILALKEKVNLGADVCRGEGGKLKIGIHATSHCRSKCWAPENFQGLIRRFGESFSLEISIFGACSEREEIKKISDMLPVQAQQKIGLPWSEVIEELKQVNLFIGVDSALCHLAAIIGIPTCILYAYTVPERTAALGDHVMIIQSNYSCCPCYQFVTGFPDDCPYHLKCIQDIAVTDVFSLLKIFLTGLRDRNFKRVYDNFSFPYPTRQLPFGACVVSVPGQGVS
ncbi:MAG: glycosyltransferase family 9 protein [Candidatus Omnitrophica bacterium]|nr:glycosyltransferase family 9 protein [Candidatus Omnitrophota bacterium]